MSGRHGLHGAPFRQQIDGPADRQQRHVVRTAASGVRPYVPDDHLQQFVRTGEDPPGEPLARVVEDPAALRASVSPSV